VVPSGVQERRGEDLGHPVDFLRMDAQLVQLIATQLIEELQYPHPSE
jgi:hypothetical protein